MSMFFAKYMSESQVFERKVRPAATYVWAGLLACLMFAGFAAAAQAHPGVSPGSCNGCHNGVTATGKPAGHIVTAQSCDMCHMAMVTLNFQSFAGGTFPVATPPPVVTPPPVTPPVTPPPVKPPVTPPPVTPPPVNRHGHSAEDDSEDNTGLMTGRGNTGAGGAFVHPAVMAGCASCHNGATAMGKPRDHIVTSLPCETCHTSTRTFAAVINRNSGAGAVTKPGAAAGQGKGKRN